MPKKQPFAERGLDRHDFESVDAFMAYAYDPYGSFVLKENRYNRARYMTGDFAQGLWCGLTHDTGVTSEMMHKIVSEGWLEGLALVYERMEALDVPYVPSIKRRLTWTDQGDHLDMARVYNGQLDVAWQVGRRREGQGPRMVRIAVDNVYPGYADAQSVAWRGIAAIAVAQALTDAGHSVELVSAMKIGSGRQHLAVVTTKAAMMPLDVANVAATTALSGFFRHVGHCWYLRNATHNCYGGSVETVLPKDVHSFAASDVYLADNTLNSQEAAQAWVKATVDAFAEGPNNR